MKLLSCALIVGFVCYSNADDIDIPGKKPVGRPFGPREAALKKTGPKMGEIRGHDNKNRDYNIDGQRNHANAHAVGSSKNWNADMTKGDVKAKSARGNNADIKKTGAADGAYKTDRNQGTLAKSKQGSDDNVALVNNGGRKKLDTKVAGGVSKLDAFEAKGTNGKVWQADPSSTNSGGSKGQLKRASAGKVYNYEVNKGNDVEQGTLEDVGSTGLFGKSKKYTCDGQKTGVSTCKDEFGRKVGEVRTAVNGDTVVTNSLGIPVATVRAQKDPRTGESTAVVTNGLFKAKSTKQQDMNCPGFTNDKVKIRKPLKFKYSNQKVQNGITFDWPDCFTVTGTLDLAPGIQAKNLAIKFVPLILPAGRMICTDPATEACGGKPGDCYYCDLCDPKNADKVQFAANQRSNVCEGKGGTFQATGTVCPPPEVNQFKFCDEFKKPLGDPYWKKKGNLDVTMEVYNRPDAASVQTDLNDPRKKAQISADYKKDPDNLQDFLNFNIPNDKLATWYRQSKAEKVGCRESIVNYDVSGSKVNTGFLFEAATASGALQKQKCPNQRGK